MALKVNTGTAMALYSDFKNLSNKNSFVNYYEFSVANVASFRNYLVYFQVNRDNASGPGTMVMQWSTDGVNYTNGTTFNIAGDNKNWIENLFDMSSIAGLNYKTNLYFRLYINDLNGSPQLYFDNFQLLAQTDEIVNATVSSTNVTCVGQANGTITVNNTNSGIWEYSRNGGFTWQDANVFTGLSAGIYDVVMRDKSNPACNVAINRELVLTQPNGTPGVWTGAVSTDWFNCANWASGSVPDNTVNVQLPSSASRVVVIDPNSPFAPADKIARARDISIDKNVSFNNAGALYLAGNWQNNLGVSGFSAGTGEVRFMSSSSKQNINTSGAFEIFNRLTIANTSNQATSDEVTLLKPVTISPTGVFALVKGRLLTTSVNSLTLTNDAPAGVDAVGAGNDTYINGPMSWNALFTGGEYTFPVGKPNGPYGAYRPVGITPNIPASPGVAQTTIYTSEYFPTAGPGIATRTFLGILQTEHWEIARPAGSLDAVVKLIYIKPNSGDWLNVDPCSTCNVAIAKQYSTTWYFTNYTNTSSGFDMTKPESRSANDVTGPVYSKLLSNFSPFTFGYDYNIVLGNPQTPVVRIKSFNAVLNGFNGELDWNLDGASSVQKVDLEYSTDGTNFTKLSSFGPTLYGFYQYTHQQLSAGKHYYRLVVFYNQTGKLVSEIRILELGKFKTVIHDLPITVVKSQLMIDIQSAASQAFETRILSTSGALLSTYQGQLNMGSNKQPINIPFLSQGLYIVQVRTQDGVSRTMKFMRE
jgi:hypothetical protein